MVCSKFLKHSNTLICRNLQSSKYYRYNAKPYLLNTAAKVTSYDPFMYISKCQYSSILGSKSFLSPASKCVSSFNLTALFSDIGRKETYEIVITNPSEGTTNTLNTTLNSVNEIKTSEELSAPTSDITDIATTLSDQLATVADVVEPSLASLGLANWTPVGLVQMFLEYLHITLHCPWWMAIIACTVGARILLIPLLIKTQKNAINMSNYMPQLQYLQAKFSEARRTGNSMEATRYSNEMMVFMKDKNINPLKSSMLPMLQAPVFLSFFFALRTMAKTPVESMKDGGIWWVTDLTIPDPYYILPVIACGTLYIILKEKEEQFVHHQKASIAVQFQPSGGEHTAPLSPDKEG